jgi:membrane-bound serine protease (ClpP class)
MPMLTDLILPIVLQLIGIAVIVAEVLLPSAGILTIVAVGIIGYSLFHVFSNLSVGVGMIFVAADLLLIPIAVVLSMRMLANSPAALKTTLSRALGVASQDSEHPALLGKEGIATTDLRPAGKALIEQRRYDVVSTGSYIARNSKVVVSKVDGNRIVVKEISE